MNRHLSILDPEAEMLADLGEGIDETELKERILMRISVWVEEYTQLFFENPWVAKSDSYEDSKFIRWAEKLWNVWKYHWKSSQKIAKRNKLDIDLFKVAEMVQLETGYTGGGKLGGNPFRDILLVDAINHGEQTALTFFYEDYLGLAKKINPAEDWWHDFNLSHVLERKRESGLPAIANYDGKAGLARWVNTAAIRFLSKQREEKLKYKIKLDELTAIKKHQAHQESSPKNDSSKESTTQTVVEWNECFGLLGKIILDLINLFPAKDTLIFKLRLLDGLTQERIGNIVEKNKGQISRDLKRLKQDLLKKLASYTPGDPEKKEKCEQCLELLTLPAFFKELASWLKEENNASQDEERNEQ